MIILSARILLSYPSHLPITGQEAIKAPKIAHNLLQRFPNNQCSQSLDGTHHCSRNRKSEQPSEGNKDVI